MEFNSVYIFLKCYLSIVKLVDLILVGYRHLNKD